MKVKDLAELLSLSPATVSLVLNNRPGISEATRNRVKQAVRELGCEELLAPETQAPKKLLFLVYRKHGIDPSSTSYFSQLFSEIIEGVENQSRAKQYHLMISYTDSRSLISEVEKMKTQDIEGILVLATEMEEEQFEIFQDIRVPVVIIDNYVENSSFDCVTIHNEQGVFQVVDYLTRMGHKRIGYLHVCKNANNFTERYFGFLRAMQRCGQNVLAEDMISIETEGGEAVFEELKGKLKAFDTLPTAFFADNDIVATCAMKAFRELGRRIPEDVSIVGFDNMTLSEMLDPPLTTIQIPKYRIGVEAVNLIVEQISESVTGSVKIEVSTQLVERRSVMNLNAE